MKKFLIFLVAIVVVVCFGATTYYFLRNDEVIKLSKSSLQINLNETFSLRAKDYTGLGLTVTKKNRNTKYGYEVYQVVNGEKQKVEDCIIYDSASDTYLAKKGGQYIFTVTTTNKKYKNLSVNVTVGDGNDNPYFIRSASDFSKYLGTETASGVVKANAVLLNDITLSDGFTSLPKYEGNFNGNGKTISGLNITDTQSGVTTVAETTANAGLFTEITGNVSNLILNAPKVSGQYDNAGALAGVISEDAVISGVQVINPEIANTKADGKTGGLAGTIKDDALIAVSYTSKANISTASAAGGLVGVNDKADIKASYAKEATINATATEAAAGGLVGEFKIAKSYENERSNSEFQKNGTIQQSYTDSTALIGKLSIDGDALTTSNSEPYSYLVGNYSKDNGGITKDESGLSTIITNAPTNSKPNTINKLPEDENPYIFYKDVEWQANLWDFSGETPSLKLANGISSDNVNSPDQDYYLGVVEPERSATSEDLKSSLGTNKDKIALNSGTTYELEDKYDFTNRSLVGEDEDGNAYQGDERPVVRVSKGLLNTMTNSTVANIILEVTGVEATDVFGAVANVATGSNISNVTVKFVKSTGEALELELADTIVTFGGVAGTLTDSTISGCDVEGLNIKSSKITKFGGIAAASTNSTIKINNNKVEATINTRATTKAQIGGVAATSDKEISGAENINLAVNLNVASLTATADISAIAADNDGTVDNIKLNGVVSYPSTFNGELNVAGVAVNNNGAIANVYYEAGAIGDAKNGEVSYNHVVAGLAVNNNGSIAQTTVKANLNGANVSGIVSNMAATSATVDQVYVGGKLYGSKFVIGLCYSANYGTITNVQAESIIEGQLSNTQVSALVYEFNNGGTVQYVTVNSAFDGNGVFHRDTQYANAGDVSNIHYAPQEAHSGVMDNVVINTEALRKNGVNYYQSMYHGNDNWFAFLNGQITSNNVNFIRELGTNDFNNSGYYSGESSRFTVSFNKGNTQNLPYRIINRDAYNHILSFSIGEDNNTWIAVEGAGIKLAFLSNIPVD